VPEVDAIAVAAAAAHKHNNQVVYGRGSATVQEGGEDGLKHHNVQLDVIGWEGTDGLPTPQTQQPTAELN
jgi:hypothetical protein